MRKMMTVLLLALLAFPILLLVLSLICRHLLTNSDVQKDLHIRPDAQVLYVLVHGMSPDTERWDRVTEVMAQHGHVLRLSYPAQRASNADPLTIARRIGDRVAEGLADTKATRIVFVAHSMGALLTRRAILEGRHATWTQHISRVVFLAGVNRGWDLSGPPPADVDTLYRFGMRLGYWGAHMLDMSKLVFAFERGSPFVSNLRLDWMRWMRDKSTRPIEVVQMLGDIDDIVRREDNEDLRVIASRQFAQLLIRGTGHGEIVDLVYRKGQTADERQLRDYRRDKLVLAATADFSELRALDQSPSPTMDTQVTDLVFVLHGIRDLGRWSAKFEQEILAEHPQMRGRLAIVSPRYGYFGMGPFLFEGVRKRYVRWFMDEYTEALARFPNVEPTSIRFFGHSNGTYLVAEALRTYKAMQIERVVFAGSVVPRAFDWAGLTTKQPGELRARVGAVRNYVGTEDWVVALFPRLFELPIISTLLRNPIGSAGFNGFTDNSGRVDNVYYVEGQHSAYESRIPEIVAYLMGSDAPARVDQRGAIGHVLASPLSVAVVWLALIYAVLWLGARVVGASPQPTWPALAIYVAVVFMVLRTV